MLTNEIASAISDAFLALEARPGLENHIASLDETNTNLSKEIVSLKETIELLRMELADKADEIARFKSTIHNDKVEISDLRETAAAAEIEKTLLLSKLEVKSADLAEAVSVIAVKDSLIAVLETSLETVNSRNSSMEMAILDIQEYMKTRMSFVAGSCLRQSSVDHVSGSDLSPVESVAECVSGPDVAFPVEVKLDSDMSFHSDHRPYWRRDENNKTIV